MDLRITTLSEGISSIVYHYTYLNSLKKICDSNAFILSPTFLDSDEDKLSKNKLFYLSTTRSKRGGWERGDVRLKLDGVKLAHNLSGVPINYYKNRNAPDEMEDRIISDTPRITDAYKYILEVHIFSTEDVFNSIISYFNKYKVPVYIYTNKNDFLNGNVNKASVEYNTVNLDSGVTHTSDVADVFNIIAVMSIRNNNLYDKIKQIYNLSEDDINVVTGIIKTANYNKVQFSKYIRDELRWLIATKDHRELIELLGKDIKKVTNTNSVRNYINYKLKPQYNNLDIKYKVNMLYRVAVSKLLTDIYKLPNVNVTIDGIYYDNIIKVPKIKELYNKVFKRIMDAITSALDTSDITPELIEDISFEIDNMVDKYSKIIFNSIKPNIDFTKTSKLITSEFIYDNLSSVSDSILNSIINLKYIYI